MDRLGRDELFYKIVDGHIKDALEILDEVENVDIKDKNGYSYLHIAVQCGSVEIIRKLLSKGADINIADNFGKTPLMIAIWYYKGDRTIIDLLLENGADKEMSANSGMSCRQLAAMKGVEL